MQLLLAHEVTVIDIDNGKLLIFIQKSYSVTAKRLLTDNMESISKLYGAEMISMNVHSLLHVNWNKIAQLSHKNAPSALGREWETKAYFIISVLYILSAYSVQVQKMS